MHCPSGPRASNQSMTMGSLDPSYTGGTCESSSHGLRSGARSTEASPLPPPSSFGGSSAEASADASSPASTGEGGAWPPVSAEHARRKKPRKEAHNKVNIGPSMGADVSGDRDVGQKEEDRGMTAEDELLVRKP